MSNKHLIRHGKGDSGKHQRKLTLIIDYGIVQVTEILKKPPTVKSISMSIYRHIWIQNRYLLSQVLFNVFYENDMQSVQIKFSVDKGLKHEPYLNI